MTDDHLLLFDTLHLDTANECVWCDERAIQLTPKAFALLRYLAEHAGQLVTKDDLLNAVWPEVVVSENVLTTHVNIIRQALGDKANAPRYIETVHRRGYRFIAPLSTTQPVPSSKFQVPSSDTQDSALRTQHSPLVGRATELTQLHKWLKKALNGERQVVFVTGEAGIGKTTVVEAFLADLRQRATGNGGQGRQKAKRETDPRSLVPDPWVSGGQCIEQFGAGEAYLPLLAAFGQLGRGADHKQVLSVLHQYAPTWLLQMPALVPSADFEGLQRRTAGATRGRMLREMAEALEALTVAKPLVLVLEDLHWSDPSTLELLSFVARRRQPARLLVIGTYRPVEVLANGHPLRAVTQELQLHHHCEDLLLPLLNEDDIVQYLADRLSAEVASQLPLQPLAQAIHRRTEGNPLFMVNVVDDLLARGVVDRPEIELSTPMTVRQMIERQFDHLSPAEQHVLEAASVTGVEFSATAVAAGLETALAEVETHCADLARREQFLRRSVSNAWPDGTMAACYRFHHALCQEVVYERVAVSRRSILHQRIGERLEAAYGERAREIAAELAVQFERGRDYSRAVQYLRQAGKNAARRSAYVETISHLTRGVELLKTLPDTPERAQQELTLQIALGSPLMATKGYAAPEAERAYARARELCEQVGETQQLFPILHGLCGFSLVRAEHHTARELGEQFLRLAQSVQAPAFLVEAHFALGQPLFFLGEFSPACEHFEQGIALYNPQEHNPYVSGFTQDPGVACLSFVAWILWLHGYPDQALKRSHEALTLAQELSHPFSLVYAHATAARFHLFRREVQAARERAEAGLVLCAEHGFALRMAQGTIFRGWALSMQGQEEEGIAQLRDGLATYRATGAELFWPSYLAMLAEAYGKGGQAEEGLVLLAEALATAHKTGERWYEAELYRLKGELLLAQARERATGNGQRGTGNREELPIPDPCCPMPGFWFTEGFDTKDLQEAKALIEELSH